MTAEDKTAIRAVVTAIHKALRDRDAAAVTAHYVSDAMVFDLAPPLSHTVDRAAVAAWLGTWKGPVERQARELGITVSGDLALWHGYFRTTATTTAGDHAVWWERATLAFRREAGPGESCTSTPRCPFTWTAVFVPPSISNPEQGGRPVINIPSTRHQKRLVHGARVRLATGVLGITEEHVPARGRGRRGPSRRCSRGSTPVRGSRQLTLR